MIVSSSNISMIVSSSNSCSSENNPQLQGLFPLKQPKSQGGAQ